MLVTLPLVTISASGLSRSAAVGARADDPDLVPIRGPTSHHSGARVDEARQSESTDH